MYFLLVLVTLRASPSPSPETMTKGRFVEARWADRIAAGTYDCNSDDAGGPKDRVWFDAARREVTVGTMMTQAFGITSVRRVGAQSFDINLTNGETASWTWLAPGRARTSLTQHDLVYFTRDEGEIYTACVKEFTQKLLPKYVGVWRTADGGVIRVARDVLEFEGQQHSFSFFKCQRDCTEDSLPRASDLCVRLGSTHDHDLRFSEVDGGVVLERVETVGAGPCEFGVHEVRAPLAGGPIYRHHH